MAVRVVGPPKDLRRIACGKCGYELEYRPNDVQTGGGPDPYGMDYEPEYRYITCPRTECGQRVTIASIRTATHDDFDL